MYMYCYRSEHLLTHRKFVIYCEAWTSRWLPLLWQRAAHSVRWSHHLLLFFSISHHALSAIASLYLVTCSHYYPCHSCAMLLCFLSHLLLDNCFPWFHLPLSHTTANWKWSTCCQHARSDSYTGIQHCTITLSSFMNTHVARQWQIHVMFGARN